MLPDPAKMNDILPHTATFRAKIDVGLKTSNAQFAWLRFDRAPTAPRSLRLCCTAVGKRLPELEYEMSPLKTISEKLNTWRRYREAVRELSQLSDRELNDIGIRRGDIEDIVRRSVTSKAAA
jgi:uncharacterized protein YjiS (DUF1127 family)